MRNILFQGNRFGDGEWVYGDFRNTNGMSPCNAFIVTRSNEQYHSVHPGSVGQFTGMHEFVAADESRNAMLFEGDIVEVWSRRRPYGENISIFREPTSKYDVEIKARAVICFKYGEWRLDYDNDYNKSLCKLKGNEQSERTVDSSSRLYSYNCKEHNEKWLREHNNKLCDIVKIGNKFGNPELLEG